MELPKACRPPPLWPRLHRRQTQGFKACGEGLVRGCLKPRLCQILDHARIAEVRVGDLDGGVGRKAKSDAIASFMPCMGSVFAAEGPRNNEAPPTAIIGAAGRNKRENSPFKRKYFRWKKYRVEDVGTTKICPLLTFFFVCLALLRPSFKSFTPLYIHTAALRFVWQRRLHLPHQDQGLNLGARGLLTFQSHNTPRLHLVEGARGRDGILVMGFQVWEPSTVF